MYKASIIGIDNTGKTSVVKSLRGIDGVNTIHLTYYGDSSSDLVRITGNAFSRLARFGEKHNVKPLTGFAYLMHLAPYFFEERAMNNSPLLVSDRDPIIDTICYSDFYLDGKFSGKQRVLLKFMLERVFNYPGMIFHLEASPETSANRNHTEAQLHEEIRVLERLKGLFEEEISSLERGGTKVLRIDTDIKSLEEVADEVKFNLMALI